MVLIPAGAFTIGNSIAADTDITNAEPVLVNLSPYYLGINEVTLSKWQSVYYWATSHGYSFTNAAAGKAAHHPVQAVDWYDCVKWCNAHSEMERLMPCFRLSDAIYRTGESNNVVCNWNANGYRLPTEAEWERAARGGLVGQRFPWGDVITQNLANYYSSTSYSYDLGPSEYNPLGKIGSSPYTTPVGTFAPNGYGLHDMAGNVYEWCWDWYGTSYAGSSDPRGPSSGSYRVLRGGSWWYNAYYCRAAYRLSDYLPSYSIQDVGFRVARSTVELQNHPPVANAGGPYVITAGDSLTLHGSASDPDIECGETLTFRWYINSDPLADFPSVAGSMTWAYLNDVKL